MRLFALVLSCALVPGAVYAAEANQPELRTVESLDLDRYLGRWYEVARLPNRFQKKCTGDVTAHYSEKDGDKIRVVNECRTADSGLTSAEGTARRVGEAKLEVRFAPAWLSFLPMVWGDYWVIDLADDYSWAVVGDPSREYFWILSRLPRLDEDVIQGIIERAEAQGFDLSTLVRTKHSQVLSAL